MAVPTVYSRLLQEFESRPVEDQRVFTRALRSLRLMISGSAALPRTVFEGYVKEKDSEREREGVCE